MARHGIAWRDVKRAIGFTAFRLRPSMRPSTRAARPLRRWDCVLPQSCRAGPVQLLVVRATQPEGTNVGRCIGRVQYCGRILQAFAADHGARGHGGESISRVVQGASQACWIAECCGPSAVVVEQPPLADALLVTAGPQGLRVGGYTPAGGQSASKVTIHWEPSPLLPATRQLTEEDAAAAIDDDDEAPMSPTKVKPNSSAASSSSSPSSAVPSKLPNGRLRLGNDGSPDAPMQWVAEGERPEAVIFLHGFNSPIADALKRVAQLWTLGDFPSNYELFVFGWPGGRDVTYFSAKAWCNDHPLMNADFTEFITSLIDAGYGRIHMLCHSMGAMILLSALSYEPFLKLFRRPGGGDGAGRGRESSGGGSSGAVASPEAEASPVGRLRMSTCILINPDASLEQFKARGLPTTPQGVRSHHSLCRPRGRRLVVQSEKFQLYRSMDGRLSWASTTPAGFRALPRPTCSSHGRGSWMDVGG